MDRIGLGQQKWTTHVQLLSNDRLCRVNQYIYAEHVRSCEGGSRTDLIVKSDWQVDRTDDEIGERQVGDKHIRRRPHLTSADDADEHEEAAERADHNDHHVDGDDDGCHGRVTQHVELGGEGPPQLLVGRLPVTRRVDGSVGAAGVLCRPGRVLPTPTQRHPT